MRLAALPPVRREVPLKRGSLASRTSMERFFGGRRITLYTSGTAALAQAIGNCAARSAASAPEVIIPAYGCPDLVAACIHASVYPRLVDVAPSRWSYDLRSLRSTLSRNTVAIVAVNLLGLDDGAVELLSICKEKRVALIQDSAQYLPREAVDWPGDYIILSFGRGKPLNLLHGGALISPSADRGSLSVPPAHYTRREHLLSGRAAAVAFNILTRPTIYRFVSALPGTGLGKVIYKPIASTALLPDHAWQRVGPAFEQYCQKASYRREIWAPAMEEWTDLGIIPLASPDSPLPAEPLRLAMLAPDRAHRDIVVGELNRAGLGATQFYGTDLTKVAGIPEMVVCQGPFPNASSLADRIFTLPTHDLVNADAVRTARTLVSKLQHSRDT